MGGGATSHTNAGLILAPSRWLCLQVKSKALMIAKLCEKEEKGKVKVLMYLLIYILIPTGIRFGSDNRLSLECGDTTVERMFVIPIPIPGQPARSLVKGMFLDTNQGLL
jgi:hypothetical protein